MSGNTDPSGEMDREFTNNPFVTDDTPDQHPAVIIAGSRAFDEHHSEDGLATLVESVLDQHGVEPAEVVSGGARGPDQAGERAADRRGIPVQHFPVQSHHWNELGGVAGHMRNEAMALYADELVALWDGESAGTEKMISLGERHLGADAVHVTEFDL